MRGPAGRGRESSSPDEAAFTISPMRIAVDAGILELPCPTGVERARRGPGLGLAGMEERVHLLGGTWQCKSEPGNGTRITVTVPVLYREGEVEGLGSKVEGQ